MTEPIYDEFPVVDSEWDAATFGQAPVRAILHWEQISLDRLPNGPRRENPDYVTGPMWHGFPALRTAAERLLAYRSRGWVSDEQFAKLLPEVEVLVVPQQDSGLWLSTTGHILAFTSWSKLPEQITSWRRVQVKALRREFPERGLVLNNGSPLLKAVVDAAGFGEISGPERPAVDEFAPIVDPRFVEHCTKLREEYGTNPIEYVTKHAKEAKQYGFEFTLTELMAYARGYAICARNWANRREGKPVTWPDDLRANGLIEHYEADGSFFAEPWAFGKYCRHNNGMKYGVRSDKLIGAFVGFALGEALGLAAEAGRFPDDGPLRWGGLTRQLLAQTESVMLGFDANYHRGDPIPASLPPARQDSWLAIAAGETPPAPQEFASLLTTALAAATAGGDRLTTNFPIVPEVARELIGSAAGPDLADSVLLLAKVLHELLEKRDFSYPFHIKLEEIAEKGDAVAKSIVDLRADRTADEAQLDALGDGRSPSSVLARALLAAARRDYDARTALTLTMHQSPIVCALVGALLGAHLGMPELPSAWVDSLEGLGLVHNMAEDAYWHFAHWGAFGDGDTERQRWEKRYPPLGQ
ncbi:hypothetical protein [Amycolatopsis sp. NPDC059657]|uniref:hypothetical protein n=1 Tax=Amycolatopsis sp. NPDC059657 TaxID=3346899 RepID=UPI0036707F5E